MSVKDILRTSKTPNFYFAFRQAQDSLDERRWNCVGHVWASYHACAGYCSELAAIDCFFKESRYYSGYIVVCFEQDNIKVPKLLSAAIQLYGDLGSRLTHKQRESLEEHHLCSPQASSNDHRSPASTWSPSSVVTTTSLQGNASSRSMTLSEDPETCIADEDTSSTRNPTT